MVIMEQNNNNSNSLQSIGNGIQNGIQSSIQNITPQMYALREKIINKSNNYYLLDDQKQQQLMQDNSLKNRQDNSDNISYLDSKLNKVIGIKDSEFHHQITNSSNNTIINNNFDNINSDDDIIYNNNNNNNNISGNDNLNSSTSSTSSFRLRSLSAPGSTTNSIPGTKNQRELFQQSIDTLAAKFSKNNNININSTNNSSSIDNSNNISVKSSLNDSSNNSIKKSQGSDEESEELSNIDEEIKRMRSSSLTSFEAIKRIERDRGFYSPREDALSPYEMLSHLEYQERIEKEEQEREEKNHIIISSNTYSEGYTGNETTKSSSLNHYHTLPKVNTHHSSSSSSRSCFSPTNTNNNSNNLSSSPTRSSPLFKRSFSNNVIPLSKSASKLPTCNNSNNNDNDNSNNINNVNNDINKNDNNNNNNVADNEQQLQKQQLQIQQQQLQLQQQQLEQQQKQLEHQQLQLQQLQQQSQQIKQSLSQPSPPPQIVEQINTSSINLKPKKVQPLVKSLSSQTILKQAQQQAQLSPNRPSTPQAMVSSPNLSSLKHAQQQVQQQLSPNRPSTPVSSPSSSNSTTTPTPTPTVSSSSGLKRLTSKLSLSTHSLPSSNNSNGDSNNTTPSLSANNSTGINSSNKFMKSPSGNSISLKKSTLNLCSSSKTTNSNSLNSSSNSSMINNSFQLELKQHLKKKQESTATSQAIERKEKFEKKKSTISKPMEEPSSSSNTIKVTFQFGTGKKITRNFQSDCKVEVLKDYIEWLSVHEPQIFDSSFKLSDDSFYRIIDYDFCYTLQPTKISISNFNVTFKESGFTPKSNLINISIV